MSLLNIIKKNQGLRELFGERELKIIEKQFLGIKLTPSEKTRLSRDIRKKFDAIKLLAPYTEEFELKHGAEVKHIVEEIKGDILHSQYYPKIKRILLFGSTVKNERTFRSDIDIAVEFTEITNEEAFKFRIKFSENKNIDVQVFNVLPEKIKKSILNNNNLLYERK